MESTYRFTVLNALTSICTYCLTTVGRKAVIFDEVKLLGFTLRRPNMNAPIYCCFNSPNFIFIKLRSHAYRPNSSPQVTCLCAINSAPALQNKPELSPGCWE